MKIVYDSKRNQKNIRERNLSFDEALNLEWETAIFTEDTRKQYPERRFIGAGLVNGRLHIICFTPIDNEI